jgi:hypothetical protein
VPVSFSIAPEKNNLKEERFILARVFSCFSLCSLGHIAVGLRYSIMVKGENHGHQEAMRKRKKEGERERERERQREREREREK